jgi:hypothetical protein
MKIVNAILLLIVIVAGAHCITAQSPVLLTRENSSRAITLDSVTQVAEPLPVVAPNNFTQDHRTRAAFFGINMALMAGENFTAVTANARDSRSKNYSLQVEFVGQVPALNWLTQVVVRLPDELAQAGDVWVSISLRGQTSNEVLFNVKQQLEPRQVTLPARRVINGQDNFADACFSFEFGLNGEANVRLTRNDWDILFGNSPDKDTFQVTLAGDDRSRIQDMGPLNWSDSFQVPVLIPLPAPANTPGIDAVVGHMYVVHTKDTTTDLYALFRVEALVPLTSVTISWKSVQSPE